MSTDTESASAPESDPENSGSHSSVDVEGSDNESSSPSSPEHVAPKKQNGKPPAQKNDKPPGRTHPPMMEMILGALENLPDKKGATTTHMKNKIIAEHPEADGPRFKGLFKRVFLKAVDDGVLVRTKATENATGLVGRFKLADNPTSRKTTADAKPPAAAKTAKSGAKKSASTDAGPSKRTENSAPAKAPSAKAPKPAPSKTATKPAKAAPGTAASGKLAKKSGSTAASSSKTTKPAPDKTAAKAPVKSVAAPSGSKTSAKSAPAKAAAPKRPAAGAVAKKPAKKQTKNAASTASSE